MPEIGQTISHYRIIDKLGQGGMGEVFLALDSALNRKVALKFLPEMFMGDPDRAARFEREAKLLASLNHTNIAAIYGLEQVGHESYLVLELVEGETLGERITRNAVPLDEALDICRQIAEGLEAAHEKGIVHRDLKPANVKLTPEGKIKVLDFGLAKVQESAQEDQVGAGDVSEQATLTAAATQAGVILGTVAYMSPEQARGKTAGKPTDIWAFGCVLFELISGRMAFRGETSSDLIAAILQAEPDWSCLPDSTPEGVRRLLRRCLRKDASHRIQHFADVRLEIEEAMAAAPPIQPSKPTPSRLRTVVLAAGILFAVLTGMAIGFLSRDAGTPAATDWEGNILGGSTVAMRPHVSPDGNMLSFQAMEDGLTQIAVMTPATGNWRILTHDRTRGLIENNCWSSDGSRIYYSRYLDGPRGVFSVPVLGGEERLVLEDALVHQVLPDGSLLVSQYNAARQLQLHRFWSQKGDLKPLGAILYTHVGNTSIASFRDGKEVVFVGKPPNAPAAAPDHLYALDLASGQTRRLAPKLSFAALPYALPLAIDRDDRAVLLIITQGNLRRIMTVPRDGGSSLRTVATLTMQPFGLDVASDGCLYVDQAYRPIEITRFTSSGMADQHIAIPGTNPYGQALPLPDGRILISGADSKRLLFVAPGKDPVPFIDTDENTSGPMTMIGGKDAAFMTGTAPNQTLVIASIADGRIHRRLMGVSGSAIKSMAASPDGQTIYYVSAGNIWTIPAADGEPKKIRAGDAVAVDPRGAYLIVSLAEKAGARLMRVPIGGGAEEPIRIRSEIPLNLESLSPNAVGTDGRIALQIAPKDSWFWPAGVLDPASGQVTKLSAGYDVDMSRAGWTSDGHMIVWSSAFSCSIWRLRPSESNSNQ